MPAKQIPVIVIFGPTGTGKTALAEAFFSKKSHYSQFQNLHGKAEIINADSMQVYKGMDIGTAKIEHSLLEFLPHHLINIKKPNEQFGAGDFVREADKSVHEIFLKQKVPVIVGGTGFYIKNFLYGLPSTPESIPSIRNKYIEQMSSLGAETLMQELMRIDPLSASKISSNDEYRIIRALEVYEISGRQLSSFSLPDTFRQPYTFLLISLYRPRAELYERIRKRVLEMVDRGLSKEVETLVQSGYTAKDPGMKAIGYKEFFDDDGRFSKEPIHEISSKIMYNSCRYAKRQETFIRPIQEFNFIEADNYQKIYELILKFLKTTKHLS